VNARRLDARRLALVTDRFGSPHDGERLAALEAAGRILAAGGVSWRELIDGAALQADDDTDDGEPVEAHHYHQVRELLIEGRHCLTQWERQFLTGLLSFRALSGKQQRTLEEIGRKVDAAATWCAA